MANFEKNSNLAQFLPSGMTMDDVYVLMAAFAAFFTVWAVGKTLIDRDPLAGRRKALEERRSELRGELLAPSRRKRAGHDSAHFMRAVVERLHLMRSARAEKIRDDLLQAGWRSKDAMFTLVFFKLVCPIGFFVVSLLLVHFDFSKMSETGWQLLLPVVGGYFGFIFPDIWVSNIRGKRWHKIRKGIPDMLDLMMVCAEAGLTLAAALDRVAKELKFPYPELADELSLTSIEIGFLPERKKALENFQKRVALPEVRGLVGVLIQTEKYGTPVAQALRVLSAEFRQQRVLRAEQKAARLPAIMTVPMIVFILPCLFIVILTPAALQLMDQMATK